MSATIYQEIWDADQATHGIPAIRPGDSTDLALGFVRVDERASEVGDDHRVLTEVVIPDAKRTTYDLCEKLFNNYQLDPGVREIVTPEESIEEQAFIDAIVPLPPLQVAKAFIASELGQTISDLTLGSMIRETWFLQGRAGSKHASGFEHVFVGEQKAAGDLPDSQAVSMGGYHFWYKYHLDDSAGLSGSDDIAYHSTRYSGADRPEQGLLVPEIVTLSFTWQAHDFTTGEEQLLIKPIGGFWVGCSAEGLIALGLVRARTKAPKVAAINSATYQIDLHRLDDNRDSIRTFFPRFKSSDFRAIDDGTPTNDPPTGTTASEEILILAALVNPPGDDAGKETLTLLNSTPASRALDGWSLQAPNGTRFVFADVTLAAGEVRTFRLPSGSAQLRNRAGDIRLLEPSEALHHRVHYSREQAKKQGFTVAF